MTRPKAQFKGQGEDSLVQTFSERLRKDLRKFDPRSHSREDLEGYRAFCGVVDPTLEVDSPHPSEEFVAVVLSAAQRAVVHRYWQQFEVGKQDLQAEIESLRRGLVKVSDQLRSMSATFARMLEIEADQVELANNIDQMIRYVEQAAGRAAAASPLAKRPAEVDRMMASALIYEVLPVLEGFGMKIAASVDQTSGKASLAIRAFLAIAADVGLHQSPITWRNAILKYRRERRAQGGQ